MSLDVYRVSRGLNCGRSFNFFHTRRVTFQATNALTGDIKFDSTSAEYKDGGWSVPFDVFSAASVGLSELLFNIVQPDGTTSFVDAKDADLFRYLVPVPTYFGCRLICTRAYIIPGSGPGSVQFAQNNDNGIGCDFGYWFDAQGVASSAVYESAGASSISDFYLDHRFIEKSHHPSHLFDINVGMELPEVFSMGFPFFNDFNTSLLTLISQFYAGHFCSSTIKFSFDSSHVLPDPALYLMMRFPYEQTEFFLRYLAGQFKICCDFDIIWKLGLTCSYRMPNVFQWVDTQGNKMPTNL